MLGRHAYQMFRDGFVSSLLSSLSPEYVGMLTALCDLTPVLSGTSTSYSPMVRSNDASFACLRDAALLIVFPCILVCDVLILHTVCRKWWEIITPISHSAIILHAPARWTIQPSLQSQHVGMAFTMEMAVLCMLSILKQLGIVTRVVYDGWPLS